MMEVVILTDRHRGSYRVIEDLYVRSFASLGLRVHKEATPTTLSAREDLSQKHSGRVVFHNTLGDGFVPLKRCRNVALPAHEWNRYPRSWVELLNAFDGVWVTTSHVSRLLMESGLKRLPLLRPPALDLETLTEKEMWTNSRPFRFFSCGEAHFRKGHHLLVAGFLKAFPEPGEATLSIKTSPDCDWESPRSNVRFIAEKWSRSEMLSSYAGYDAYATASLAEGLGLPVAESLSARLPVVANYWGGHADLLAEGAFVRISHEEIIQPFASRPEFYAEGQHCAFSSPDEVAESLRRMVGLSSSERETMATAAKEEFLRNYGSEATLGPMKKALEELS